MQLISTSPLQNMDGNSESTNRDESDEVTKKNANTSGAVVVGGGVVKQASLDSMRYSLHRKLRKAAEDKQLLLSTETSSPFTLSASSQRSRVGTEEATLAYHREDTSSGNTTTESTVESECCKVVASSSSASSASTHSTTNDDDTKPFARRQPQSGAVERQKRSSTTFFENVVPSSLTRRASSSTATSINNSSLTSAPVVTEFVPEIAHRIRDLVLVRVKDQKRVVMESFWNNLVSEDPPTAEDKENSSSPPQPALPVLYRAPSVGDAPDHNAPIVRSQHGQPALICLFRRWGCCICRMTAASLSSLKPFLDERGIRLIGVGFESIGMNKFIKAGHFCGELYLDPSKTLYKRVECRKTNWKSLWGLASLEVWGLYAKAAKRQYQVDFQGDYSQLGAVMLIDALGVTRFLQIQTGDRFQIDTIKILETIGVTPPDDYDPLPDAHKKVW